MPKTSQEFMSAGRITYVEYGKILDNHRDSPPDMLNILNAFVGSLKSIHSVLSFPLLSTMIQTQEKEISIKIAVQHASRYILYDTLSKSEIKEIVDSAHKEATAASSDSQSMKRLSEEAETTLQGQLVLEEIRVAARELRYQAAVMLWVSLEVLASDLFICMLNLNPKLVSTLHKDEQLRKSFDLKSVPLEILIERGFDLSKRMGDLLIERHAVDTIPTMKQVYSALQPMNQALRDTLSSPRLWQLWQRRNLIAHRRGVADERYIKRTKEDIEPGTRIDVTIDELVEYFAVVRDAGAQMFEVALAALSAPLEEAKPSRGPQEK